MVHSRAAAPPDPACPRSLVGSRRSVAAQGIDVTTVALVTPASQTNLGWDQQAADGIEAVAEELEIRAEIQENAGYDDITPTLKDLKDDGAQLIICHASGYQTICPEFAAAEKVPVAVIENPNAVVPNLVSDIETQAQEAAYLAGVLAGRLPRRRARSAWSSPASRRPGTT